MLQLAALRGKAWIAARDRFCRRPSALPRTPDPRLRIVAAILAAWKKDGARFRAFLRTIDAVDVDAEARTRLGLFGPIGRLAGSFLQQFGRRGLPFAWERILRLPGREAPLGDAVFLEALRRLPDRASVEPLLWAIEEASDAGRLDALHQALIAQPFAEYKGRLEKLKRESRWRAFVAEDLLARLKLPSAKP